MKILFAINNEQITNKILEKYKELYGEELEYKSVYYFKALLAEVKKDKSYDRILIFEDLEPYVNNNMEAIDQYLFNKIDSINEILIANKKYYNKNNNLLMKTIKGYIKVIAKINNIKVQTSYETK